MVKQYDSASGLVGLSQYPIGQPVTAAPIPSIVEMINYAQNTAGHLITIVEYLDSDIGRLFGEPSSSTNTKPISSGPPTGLLQTLQDTLREIEHHVCNLEAKLRRISSAIGS